MQRIKSLSEYFDHYEKSQSDPEGFWSKIAESFNWIKPWSKVLESDFEKVSIKWFIDAKLNITENIFERNLVKNKEKTAIIWEPNNPDEETKKISYQELYEETCKFSNALKNLGIKKGDRIIIYMPMVPEAAIAMLACARVGAIHSVVFAGFSSTSLADRIDDCEAKMVITSDGNFRGNKVIPVKSVVDEALEKSNSIEKVVVLKRTNQDVNLVENRDFWWHELVADQSSECKAEVMDSEDMLFILYTSGSTGKPKGVVHTTGGYMVYSAYTFSNVFQYDKDDIYWCTADVGCCLLYTSPSPRDKRQSRMPSSA